MGEDIYQIVQEYGITTKDECNTTMIQVIEYLKIPSPIFQVRDYTTGAISLAIIGLYFSLRSKYTTANFSYIVLSRFKSTKVELSVRY